MFRPLEKYADIASVAASGTGTADIPVSGTYYGLALVCLDGGSAVSVANIKDNLTNVKLTLDGTTVYEANANAIYDLASHYYGQYGYTQTAGILPINLAPTYFNNARAAEALAWGMGGINSFQVELSFSANVGTATHTDQIQVYVQRSPVTRPLGEHYRLATYTRNYASSGDQEVTELPIAGGADVVTTAWHWQYDGSSAVINSLEAIVNNQTVRNYGTPLVAQQAAFEARRQWLVAGAANDLFSVSFNESNDPAGNLPHRGLNDLRFKINWSAAPNSHKIIRESFHGIGRSNSY